MRSFFKIYLFLFIMIFVSCIPTFIFPQNVSITPQPAYMGAIPVGSYAEREIIIYNASIQTLNISSISITGNDAASFSISNNPGSTSLGALEQLILNVRYQPSGSGNMLAMLQINSGAETFSDSLTGSATNNTQGIITFERIIGTQFDDHVSSFVQISDKGYILVGSTTKENAQFTDAYVIRTDKYGKVLWTKTYGGNYDDAASDVVQSPDGNFVIVGNSSSFGSGQVQIYLFKIDSDGNTVWEKSFGEQKDIAASNIRNTTDNSFIITGNTKDTPDNSRDALLLKTDKDGNLIWKKHYGTSNGESASGITLTSDGGYIFTGTDANSSTNDFNIYCVKTDAEGNVLWTKDYGGSNQEGGSTIISTDDGGYMISGYTVSYGAGAEDGFLVKIDSAGKEQWYKAFGYEHNDRFASVVQMPDGGYMASGSTVNYFDVNYTYTDAYLVRTNASGEMTWSKTFGGDKSEGFGRLIEAGDGTYATIANTNSYGQSQDIMFVKINENGTLTDIKNDNLSILPTSNILYQNYPNPFNPITCIRYSVSKPEHVSITIFNELGQKVVTLVNKYQASGSYTINFNASQLASGVYLYRLQAGSFVSVKKMILMK
jgi:hypothetical protein